MLRSVRAMCEATHCFQQQFGVRCNYPSASLGTRLPFSRNLVLPGSSSGAGDEGEEDGFEPGRQLGAGQGRLAWTRPGSRAQLSRRRSLSPLERVSSLIPQEMLSQEVMDLQQINQEPGPKGYTGASVPSAPTGWQAAPGCSWHLPQEEDHGWEDTACQPNPPDREVPFKPGDVVLVEFRRRHCLELQKMFNLVKDGKLHSKWGMLSHQEILGHLPGQVFRTSTGSKFILRRPSLEEFVLLMKRGPAISYPKDISAMLMMMDIGSGNHVLESGSGSGAMTLFLSRTVGSSGHVYSFEVRPDHHSNAKRNYQRWRNAWEVAHEKEWPNNVEFINKDIVTATDDIQGKMFDAVALDMLSPQLALPVVYKHLKQGGVCAVYLANITQVVDLLEGIRSCQLFFSCEKISEVIHRSWLVAPALRKDGSTAPRVKPQNNVHSESEDEQRKDGTKVLEDNDEEEDTKPFCTIPYIARPHHEQVSHTAFLVKLRKFRPAQLYSTPHKSENSSLGL
ncbi:tRNA (adenine(58)-N(1))-methyltransferase, mitochondrial isoform X1 [Hemiscyllium ocellatum]|uniref:tRNA (adenine(58)-N(1))-methyltransferase, mitochondrial isoform X1 n=1 Tax=Hemiscyllium ocellatum TaxID=170820 RepID=UPI0029676807|nr:tRNA (adenine(58)-N(1))-methyltransferase, mitochondrial isoform X1 [Hemiscyllium ocellatum]